MTEITSISHGIHHHHPIPSRETDPFFGIEQILFCSMPDIYEITQNPKLYQCSIYLNILKNIFPTLSPDQKYLAKQKLFAEEKKLREGMNIEDLQEDLRRLIEKIKEDPLPESILIRIKMIESYLFPDKETLDIDEKEAFDRKIIELKRENLTGAEKEMINRGLDTILRLFEEKKPILPLQIHQELNAAIAGVKSIIVNKRDRRDT